MDNMKTDIPAGFVEMLAEMPEIDSEALLKSLELPAEISIKLNLRKAAGVDELGYGALERVPWADSGYYLAERPIFTLNPLLHCGVFYVQEASSMIYEAIGRKIVPMALDTGHPLRVLDLCAAPGGKTTSLINALPDGSLVVANEFVASRAEILKENLMKWGYPDIVITNSPTSRFARLREMFDIVAVDAPCSGEGMMRKEETARQQWGKGLVAQCASLQREILSDAFEALKPGGFLIYSTCTFNRRENEENLRMLVEDFGMVALDMEFPEEWGISKGIDTPYPCLRFMPHKTRGEGLFAAVLRKEGDFASAPRRSRAEFDKMLASATRIIANGIPHTTLKGRDEVPTTEHLLGCDYRRGELPEKELTQEEALSFLRHETLRFDGDLPKGYLCVTYKNHPLGLVKNIGNRANNLYPAAWKIRMK